MPHPKLVVGLCGTAGSGKNAVASILAREYGYRVAAWGAALHREVYAVLGRALLAQCDPPREPTFENWMELWSRHKYAPPTSPWGFLRPLLQWYGTDYRRDLCNSDYWVQRLDLEPGIVVADCRFANEVAAVKIAGGYVWRVERPGCVPGAHASEQQALQMPADVVLLNDGTLDDLRATVRLVMEDLSS